MFSHRGLVPTLVVDRGGQTRLENTLALFRDVAERANHENIPQRLEGHFELLRCYYNFIRPHPALKFGREIRTPAMQGWQQEFRRAKIAVIQDRNDVWRGL